MPAADVLAKNMRAVESAIAASATSPRNSRTERASPTLLMSIGARDEVDVRKSRDRSVRFRRAKPESKANPISALFGRIFASKNKEEGTAAPPEKSGVQKMLEKLFPMLEKAAGLVERIPDPTLLFLALVLVILIVDRYRSHWLDPIPVRIAVVLSFIPLFALTFIWRKKALFTILKQEKNLLTHPAEHRLDGFEADLKAREEKLKKDEDEFKKNREQLDELRKEIFKDAAAHDPDAVIVPSRKAAEMIAAGALGAGFDEEASSAVEARRKEENMKRSRDEWRQRAEEAESKSEVTQERIKLMADHAATAYTKRTKELKTRSNSGMGRPMDRFMGLRKVVSVVGKKEDDSSSANEGNRFSEHSLASTAQSTASRRRLGLFRRKRRNTGLTQENDNTVTPAPYPVNPSGDNI